jgi:hypothetical protein
MHPIQAMIPPRIGIKKNNINPAKNITTPPKIDAYNNPSGPKRNASKKATPALFVFVTTITVCGNDLFPD